ncbi:MAG: L-threonylcarbamoyladenylate synthase [Bacteroidales bacterium]|nr:L-threonylcarbamoyladenylate synthase [Bacteroidales bacterium]
MNQAVKDAVDVMRKGGIILYPTDTVWGLGCDATNETAVAKIYAIKQRSDAKALITLADNANVLTYYMKEVPEIAYDLIDCADKPLTIIYPNARNLAPNLLADDLSVGIRITKEPISAAICQRMRTPIVSTSANISGHPTPHNFKEIDESIKNLVDYIVPLRQDEETPHEPSGIIKLFANGTFKIIR